MHQSLTSGVALMHRPPLLLCRSAARFGQGSPSQRPAQVGALRARRDQQLGRALMRAVPRRHLPNGGPIKAHRVRRRSHCAAGCALAGFASFAERWPNAFAGRPVRLAGAPAAGMAESVGFDLRPFGFPLAFPFPAGIGFCRVLGQARGLKQLAPCGPCLVSLVTYYNLIRHDSSQENKFGSARPFGHSRLRHRRYSTSRTRSPTQIRPGACTVQ